jgi:hypothetical protein
MEGSCPAMRTGQGQPQAITLGQHRPLGKFLKQSDQLILLQPFHRGRRLGSITNRQAHRTGAVPSDCRRQADVIRAEDLALLGKALPQLPLRQQAGEKRGGRQVEQP